MPPRKTSVVAGAAFALAAALTVGGAALVAGDAPFGDAYGDALGPATAAAFVTGAVGAPRLARHLFGMRRGWHGAAVGVLVTGLAYALACVLLMAWGWASDLPDRPPATFLAGVGEAARIFPAALFLVLAAPFVAWRVLLVALVAGGVTGWAWMRWQERAA